MLDALERALATGSSDPVFYDGVASTHRLFLAALREAGTVVREVGRGWRLGDTLLRPTQVVVAAPGGP